MPSRGYVILTLLGTHRATGRVWFDDVQLEALPTAASDDVHIFSQRMAHRPIDAKQQGQFIELLCNLIPSIIAQQVVSTSFEEAPTCRVSYKKEIDEPHRPWYPDGAVEVAQYSFDTTNPFNASRSQRIDLPAEHARAGISQDGFYLRQGVTYKVRLHMRGANNVAVWATSKPRTENPRSANATTCPPVPQAGTSILAPAARASCSSKGSSRARRRCQGMTAS